MTSDGLGPAAGPAEIERRFEVRASRIELDGVSGGALGLRSELWVGGGDSGVGDLLRAEDLEDAWVVDCAGELPPRFRAAAGRWISRVFADIDQEPPDYARTLALARSLATALAGDGAPPRLYVLCKQGFNRSGLVAGRILRELGLPPEVTVEVLRRGRPGALSNAAFRRLVME